MEDPLTQSVLAFQSGARTLEEIRNLVLLEAFRHLRRYSRKSEDEVSDFLLDFHPKIPGLLGRFQARGLPFRHFLLRTLRWQWNSFRADRSREKRRVRLTSDAAWDEPDAEVVAEGGLGADAGLCKPLSTVLRRRLVLLALKAAPYLDEGHLEAVCRESGTDLAWLQACQHRLCLALRPRHQRRDVLVEKRSEAFCRRLMAEDDARREVDPERRAVHEHRAGLYRQRLSRLSRQQNALSTVPTHLEVAAVLGMPKGSVDSGLYHLKKALGSVYIGPHDPPRRHEQRPQEDRA